MAHDIRDEVVDYVRRRTERIELRGKRLVGWIAVGISNFDECTKRYGKVDHHNQHWQVMLFRRKYTIAHVYA